MISKWIRKTLKRENSCYTYFTIKGDFNPDDITEALSLTPFQMWHIGDKRRYGKGYYDFACWSYGRCDTYSVITENQMMQTISDLVPKILLLQEIKQKYDVAFFLEVVPELYAGETTPALAPNKDVIEFCYKTDTLIDIDLYIFK